jgi:hypothetical protein
MVARAIPDAWSYAAPEAVLEARLRSVDLLFRRILGDAVESDEIAEAAALARRAAEAAPLAGHPLAAANAALPWPLEPHLALWFATTLLREHRGDGHIAALTCAGLDPCEALVTAHAAGGPPKETLRTNRKWSEEEWAAAERALTDRGLLDASGALSPAGADLRREVERKTDELAARPWTALGAAGAERLAELAGPPSATIVATGALPFPNPIGLDWSTAATRT